jgi:hypothetical protein
MKKLLLATALLALAGSRPLRRTSPSRSRSASPASTVTSTSAACRHPQLVYARPVVIQQPVGVVYQPVYLRVPPGHEKNWRKHCQRYNACGRPVYFVQDTWYTNVYAPQYRAEHGGSKGHKGNNGHDNGKGHDKGNKGKGHD